jgi:acyl-CoA synthetase (AMP-forming)/AMP-acid ligase II
MNVSEKTPNHSPGAAPPSFSIPGLLSDFEGVAILAPGRQPLTYARLRNHTDEVGRILNSWGLGKNDRIAIVLPQGPEMAIAFLTVSSNATSVPLNPNFGEREFIFYFSDIRPRALITAPVMGAKAAAVARKYGIPIIWLKPSMDMEAGIFTLSEGTKTFAESCGHALPGDTALVLYTSGTTGQPKRVPLTHTNICTSALNIKASLALSPRDRCLNVMPLFHIHGLIGAMLASLSAGGTIICPSNFEASEFFLVAVSASSVHARRRCRCVS